MFYLGRSLRNAARFNVFLPNRSIHYNRLLGLHHSSQTVRALRRMSSQGQNMSDYVDKSYPGTATKRMHTIHQRVQEMAEKKQFTGPWSEVRRAVLWAGGLKDLPRAVPGKGYTGHSFNDHNHCDLTAMRMSSSHNENEGDLRVIALGNQLGNGIKVASLEEAGPGGSWSTCMDGCNQEPPHDVAHVQFRSRIAFKLVWCPPSFNSFVLVDDDGKLLAAGTPSASPSDPLPNIAYRRMNYKMVQGSKYAEAAEGV